MISQLRFCLSAFQFPEDGFGLSFLASGVLAVLNIDEERGLGTAVCFVRPGVWVVSDKGV